MATITSRSAFKSAPRFVDATHVQVTKEFAKNAMIFGTPEYRLWKEIREDCSDAEMVTKSIKKNPGKRTATKNMTYERMAMYIREQDDAVTKMTEFKKQIALSKVQTNPYRYVLAWFIQQFEGFDSYKAFFEAEAQKEAQKKDIFTLVKSSVVIAEDDTHGDQLALVSGM